MNTLTHRLVITTALVTLIAVPVSAENLGDFSLRRTHPNHLSLGGERNGGPLDLGALASDESGVERQVAENETSNPAAALGSVAPPSAPKRKERVDFTPRFNIRAPSRRPRYERPDYGNARVMPTPPAQSAPAPREAAPDVVITSPQTQREVAGNETPATSTPAANAQQPQRPAPDAAKRTAPSPRRTRRSVPVPAPAPKRERPAAAAAAATVLASAEIAETLAAANPDRNDVPRANPMRAAPIAMPAFDLDAPSSLAADGPQVAVNEAPPIASGAVEAVPVDAVAPTAADVSSDPVAPATTDGEGAAPATPRVVAALVVPSPAFTPPSSGAAQDAADADDTVSATAAPTDASAEPQNADPAPKIAAQTSHAEPDGKSTTNTVGDEATAGETTLGETQPTDEIDDHQAELETASLEASDGTRAAQDQSADASHDGATSPADGGANHDAASGEPRRADDPAQSSGSAELAVAAADTGAADSDDDKDAEAHTNADGHGEAEGDEGEAVEPARVDNTPIPPGPTPFQLVRMLTALQDDIARGSSTALRAQRVLSRRIGERFIASAPREWADPANGRALVTYALSGGDPTVVREVVRDAWLEDPYKRLGAGALAFIEGRVDDARRHFDAVDLEGVAHSVVGSVRLAQAALAVENDKGEAMAYLDDARLVAPGTLVEEAALRRAILLASNADDLTAFENLVERYLRKFRGSVYAGNFRRRLASAVTRMSFIDDPGSIERLDPLFEPMTVGGRQELYLMIARASIENGSHHATKTAAERVLDSAHPATLDYTRAELYRAAAELVDEGRLEDATATLKRLQSVDLPEDDRSILAAALQLSQTVVTLPEPAASDLNAPMIAAHDGESGDETMAETPLAEAETGAEAVDPDDPLGLPVEVERRVAEALSAVDALLENSQ